MEAHEIYEKLREKKVSARMIAKVLDKPLETVFPHYAPKQSHQEKISVLRHQLLGLNG